MLRKRSIKVMFSAILFVAGIFLLTNSSANITGAVISLSATTKSILNPFFGVMFIVCSIVIFITTHSELEKITLSSAIKKNPPLLRLTHDAVRDQTVERELNHLIKELSKGNFEAGLGHPGHIPGTDVFYLRGRNGARLYYHQLGRSVYEIVAKSTKGRNQDQVINKIIEIYGN